MLVRKLGAQESAGRLIENIQREELNNGRAQGFATLESFGMTHEQIAEVVGLNRSTISNHLRLMDLDGPIKCCFVTGSWIWDMAGPCWGRPTPFVVDIRRKCARGWSVRRLGQWVRRGLGEPKPRRGLPLGHEPPWRLRIWPPNSRAGHASHHTDENLVMARCLWISAVWIGWMTSAIWVTAEDVMGKSQNPKTYFT